MKDIKDLGLSSGLDKLTEIKSSLCPEKALKDVLPFSKCRDMLYPLMCSNLSDVRLHTWLRPVGKTKSQFNLNRIKQ